MSRVLHLLVAALVVAGLIGSCEHSGDPYAEMIGHRHVNVIVKLVSAGEYSQSGISGNAPLRLAVMPNIELGENDNLLWSDNTPLIELDYGEGRGWEDVTAIYDELILRSNRDQISLQPDYMIPHTFEIPGEYTIKARVHYWDGEIVEAPPEWQMHVTVMPAASPPGT